MNRQSLCADESVSEIVNRYKSMVYQIALAHTNHKADADDAFQQTFLVYFTKNPVFKTEEHRKAWLIRVTLNCVKKTVQSSWRKKTVPLEEISEKGVSFISEEENLVYRAIKELPEKYRTVITLYYFEDFTSEQIGKILHRRADAINTMLMRGRKMLREKLKGDYFNEA